MIGRGVVVLGMLLLAVAVASAATETARIDTLQWRVVVTGNRVVVAEHRRITILSPAGAKMAKIGKWESEFYKIRNIDMRMISAAGKVVQKRDKGDMLKVCGYGESFVLYDKDCWYSTEYVSSEYPYSVVYDCTTEYQSLFFLRAPSLVYDAPITHAAISVQFDEDTPVRWKLYGLSNQPDVTTSGKQATVTWVFSHLPAKADLGYVLPEDINMPRLALVADRFMLDDYRVDGCSWRNLGLFCRQLCEDRYLPEAETARREATREQVYAIYQDVVEGSRYVAVNVGLSGWRPEPAAAVQARGYGDCKGLSTLLNSRLRAAGIEAYPVLVLTADEGRIDPDFASYDFNHFISCAVIGKDTVWMDPTCTTCPPGELPEGDEGTLALLVTDTGGVLVTVPSSRAADNGMSLVSAVRFDSSGSASGTVTASFRGHSAQSLRAALQHLSKDEKEVAVRQWLTGANKRYSVTSYQLDNLDKTTQPLVIHAQVSASKPFDKIQGTWYYFPFFCASRDAYDGIVLKDRAIGIDWGSSRVMHHTMTMSGVWPAAADSIVLPTPDSAAFLDWKMVTRFSRTDSVLTAELWQEYNSSRVQPAQFTGLEQFIAARRRILDKPIKLQSSRPLGLR